MPLSKTRIWMLAARPKTLPAAIAPVLIGTAFSKAAGGMHTLSAVCAMLGAVMIQIGTNLANDYFDSVKGADTAQRIGPVRVTQSGLVEPSQIKAAIAISFSLALPAGLYLVYRGGWPIVIVGLLSILFGILYTGGPYPLGYKGLGELFVFIFFGPVAAGGTYFVQTLDISAPVVIAGFGPGLLSVAILCVNNLRDIEEDRLAGKRTLAVRFGKRFAKGEYVVCASMAFAVPVALVIFFGIHPQALVSLIAIVIMTPAVRAVLAESSGERLNESLALTAGGLFLYALLLSAGLIW